MHRDFGKAFRIIRAAFGLSQTDLAARMSITASQVSLVEAGKRQPSAKVVKEVGLAVGVPLAMISLLASPAVDLKLTSDSVLAGQAESLLRLLVSANRATLPPAPKSHAKSRG